MSNWDVIEIDVVLRLPSNNAEWKVRHIFRQHCPISFPLLNLENLPRHQREMAEQAIVTRVLMEKIEPVA